jgi:hypothetical protein
VGVAHSVPKDVWELEGKVGFSSHQIQHKENFHNVHDLELNPINSKSAGPSSTTGTCAGAQGV